MTTTHAETLIGPDYHLAPPDPVTGERSITGTPEAQQFFASLDTMRETERQLNRAYVGAVTAQCLLDLPWLGKCRIRVWGSSEYDDEGGSFRSANLRVDDVVFDPDANLPEAVFADGQADEDLAAELVEEYLQEDEQDFLGVLDSIHCSVDREHALSIDRQAFRGLLGGDGPISGRDAFCCLTDLCLSQPKADNHGIA